MLLVKYIHINMDKNKRPKLYTFPNTLQAVQRPAAVPIARCSVPASGRVFRCVAWFALHLERSALGAGVSTGGVYRERRGLGGR
jgi:hypothetical protein